MKKLFIFFSIFFLYTTYIYAIPTDKDILRLEKDIANLKKELEFSKNNIVRESFLNNTEFFGKLHFEFLHSNNKGSNNYLLTGSNGVEDFDNVKVKNLKFGIKQQLSMESVFNFTLKWSNYGMKVDSIYLDYKLSPKITVSIGQIYIPLSMENEDSGNSYQLIDTTKYYNIGNFLFDNGIGLKIKYINNNFGIFSGVYGNAYNDDIDRINKNIFSFKTYFNPYKEENDVIHVGANYLNGVTNHNKERKVPNKSDNNLNLKYDFKQVEHINVDFALNFDWFNLQAEYTKSFLTPAAIDYKEKFGVSNYYIQTSFLLTGETIEYKEGAFGKVRVNNPIDIGGFGAFETAFRFAITDLQDRKSNKIFDYGKYKEFSIAFSWIPTDFLKTTLQYSRIKEHFIDDLTIFANDNKRNNGYDLFYLKCKLFF